MAGKRRRISGRRLNLLLEIGTEELPPRNLRTLGEVFASSIFEALRDHGIAESDREAYRWYATPRRLAVWIGRVKPFQPDRVEERRGPTVKAAFDADGNPTPAALGFARSCGVGVDKLGRIRTGQGEWVSHQRKVTGLKVRDIVEQSLQQAIQNLPIAKRMRWGNNSQEFVRPVHWLVAMYGSKVLKVSALGLEAGAWTRGHRFLSPGAIRVLSADRYLDALRKDGFVIADFEERRQQIERQVTRLAHRNGGTAVMDASLLEEVTGLVEWPHALYGEFDRRFLKMPSEVLVSSMHHHQKYFHMVDSRDRLQAGFVTVSNIRSRAPKRVRLGNERVLRARLADAEFFWNKDLEKSLEHRLDDLDRVLYHEKLGSVGDKVKRVRDLAAEIADLTGADAAQVSRASTLCKADLVTDLVGEFPELQGIVGGYYADGHGEDRVVSNAIRDHYLPRFSGDDLPRSSVSRCLALADRIDTIAGIFACGEIPTGDKDPHALRRASLGILRILIEKQIDLDLYRLFEQAMIPLQPLGDRLDPSESTVGKAFGFVTDRLRAYYQSLEYDPQTIASVAAVSPRRPLDFHRRLEAIHAFFTEQAEAAQSLATANKRIANILSRQAVCPDSSPDADLFQLKAETALAKKVEKLGNRARKHFSKGRYEQGLVALAALSRPIDRFFDQVMVMDEDSTVRQNRLLLLSTIRQLFLLVADISLVRAE